MSRDHQITVTTRVRTDPSTAFALFTEEVDQWWRRGPRFRWAPGTRLHFEPGEGGSLYELDADGQERRELGRVLAWEPGERLLLRGWVHPLEGVPETEVEIRFRAVDGPEATTEVTVHHRGWDAVPDQHPARDGLKGQDFVQMIGVWWADLLLGLGGLR